MTNSNNQSENDPALVNLQIHGTNISENYNNHQNDAARNALSSNNSTSNNLRNKNGTIFTVDCWRGMITSDKLDMNYLSLGRLFYINELRFKDKIKERSFEINEVYLIEKNWYRKWKNFIHYNDIKKTASYREDYVNNPIQFITDKNNNPGQIINTFLLIEDKPENLFSESELPLKIGINEKEYKLLPKFSFEKLSQNFGCDKIIKKKLRMNNMTLSREIDIITKEFNVVFLPNKNVENFTELKEYKLYLSSLLTENEIYETISEILNSPKNIEIKRNLSIDNYHSLEKYIKIYYLKEDEDFSEFKSFFLLNFEETKSGGRMNAKTFLGRFPHNFQLNKIPSNNLVIEFSMIDIGDYFDGIELDNNIELDSATHNNDDNLTNNNANTKAEFMSIFGEAKEGLQNLKIDKDNNLEGLVALGNIGNTCYMNTSVQCLSNCKILTNYFLHDYYIPFINRTNTIGSKGKIVESYAELIKHLWYGEKKIIEPYRLKNECGMVRNMFAGYNQQDAQEFISFLLDELHEDLNKVLNKPYIEKDDNLVFDSDIEECIYNKNNFLARNQSIIVDLFYGMFKSTVVCPNQDCKNISKSYDPYSVISIPINVKAITKEIFVYFIFEKFEYKIIQYKMTIPYDMGIYSFRKKIEYLFQIGYNTFEIYKNKGNELVLIKDENMGVFDFLDYNKEIYLYQIPNIVFDKSNENTVKIYEELMNNPYLLDNREKEFNGKKNMVPISDSKLEINREKWIKFYCYINSYDDEGFPNLQISLPKIFYINIDWNNNQIYNYIFEQYENLLYENEKPENLKEKLFPNLNNVTRNLSKRKNFKLDIKTHNEFNYPYMLLYEKFAPIHENLLKRYDNFKELIFPSSEKLQTIKKVIEHLKGEKKDILEHELIFKLVCSPTFKEKIRELKEPKKMINKVSMFSSKEESFNIELTSLLGQFSQLETLSEGNEWYCSKCKEFQLAEKTMEIFTCPEILIFHLKRFREGKKLDNIIEFPIKGLDMGQYIKYDETNKNDNIYDLFAVANHQGNFNGGHYVAYAKNFIKDKWYEFDDEYIKEINEDEIVSENSYVLFYQKRNSKFENIETVYKKPFTNIVFKK